MDSFFVLKMPLRSDLWYSFFVLKMETNKTNMYYEKIALGCNPTRLTSPENHRGVKAARGHIDRETARTNNSNQVFVPGFEKIPIGSNE